jgi:hypothetical protein
VANGGFDDEPIAGSYVFGDPTSADPMEAGPMADRHDKDVADCIADIIEEGGTLLLEVDNAYPSYNCTMWSTFGNQGSVPVKLQSIVTTISKDGTPNYDLSGEGTWQTLQGTLCGLQIDPDPGDESEYVTTINWFHIEQEATQDSLYEVKQTLNFVNWNEWDVDLCTHTFNGVESVLPHEQ